LPHITYAIGDIHGRADLLEALLFAIEDDASASRVEPRVLFLGDIIDRGPSSREAMGLVCDTLTRWPRSQLIRGNHDSYFLDFMTADLVDDDRFGKWLMRLGGYQTMESYGLLSARNIRDASKSFRINYPRHLEAFENSCRIVVDDRFAFVHAGIDPTRPIDDQDPKDLMLIRERFLGYDGHLSHVIVHGHTPTSDNLPEVTPWRIALDTGAYASGKLSCLAVPEDERNLHFLFATAFGGNIEVTRETHTDDRSYTPEDEVPSPHSGNHELSVRGRVGTGSESILR
jgi:serine/threonine protein phosphatase 1